MLHFVCSTVAESEEQTQVTGKKAGLENPSFVLGCCLIPLWFDVQILLSVTIQTGKLI